MKGAVGLESLYLSYVKSLRAGVSFLGATAFHPQILCAFYALPMLHNLTLSCIMLKSGQTLKILRGLHRKIFKVCFAIFNIYKRVNIASFFLDRDYLSKRNC